MKRALCLLGACAALGCSSDDSGGESEPPGVDLPAEVTACEATLVEMPASAAARGPWPVGVRTAVVEDITTEVWYPAKRAEGEQVRYDIRDFVPEEEAAKVPDEKAPIQECDCYRDAPIDDRYGPYPVIVFIHGTAAFRTQSLSQMEHWASRGFVVVSQDHPGLWLKDLIGFNFGADLPGDTETLLAALAAPSGDLGFLGGRINLDRLGMAGHSAGGGGIKGFGDRARVLAPLAAGGAEAGGALESVLVMAGVRDGVVEYDGTVEGYDESPAPKRLTGIDNAGHLAFSDLCAIQNDDGQDIFNLALDVGITGAPAFEGLWDGCEPDYLAPARGIEIVSFATTAAFEETLKCDAAAAQQLDAISSSYPEVSDYRSE